MGLFGPPPPSDVPLLFHSIWQRQPAAKEGQSNCSCWYLVNFRGRTSKEINTELNIDLHWLVFASEILLQHIYSCPFHIYLSLPGYSSNGLSSVGVGKTTSIDPHSHLRQPGM